MLVPDVIKLSPNVNRWPVDGRTVIIHCTRSGKSMNPTEFTGTLNYMASPGTTSSQWVVSRTGVKARVVADHHQAWHASEDNARCWGIEIEQGAEEDGFTEPQLAAVAEICRDYMATFNVPPVHARSSTEPGFIGHQETDQGKRFGKSDPGRLFDWDDFMSRLKPQVPEEPTMANPVWAEWKDRPANIPYRTWLLFATPEGLVKKFVISEAEHIALVNSNVAGNTPKPLSLWTLKEFRGGPEPDEL